MQKDTRVSLAPPPQNTVEAKDRDIMQIACISVTKMLYVNRSMLCMLEHSQILEWKIIDLKHNITRC
jgi:hypothetical protein